MLATFKGTKYILTLPFKRKAVFLIRGCSYWIKLAVKTVIL